MVRKLPVILYRWAVILLAYWFASYLFPLLDLDLTANMLVVTVMAALAECCVVTFPQGQLCATFTVIFFSYLSFGPAGAVWITGLGCLLGQGIARSNSLPTIFFNASQYVLAITAGDYIYTYLGGSLAHRLAWGNIIPLAGFVIACFLVNQLLVYFYLLPERKNYPLVYWRDALRWDGLTYLVTTPMGVLMALLYSSSGYWSTLLLFLPLLVMQLVLRFYVHLELANRELRAFYEVAKELGGELEVYGILELVLKEARRVARFHTGIIYVWDEKKGCYEAAALAGAYKSQLQGSHVYKGQEFLGCLAQSGESTIVYDSKRDPRVNIQPGLTQVLRSLLVIPLKSEGEVLGLFVLGDKRPLAFDENHQRIFTGLAGQAAVAVYNSKLSKNLEAVTQNDSLTGLLQRHYFLHTVEQELAGLDLSNETASLVLADVDFMHKVNYSYGLEAGDAVLSFVGKTISSVFGTEGVIGRYDGQQFAVFLPGSGEARAAKLAEEARLAVGSGIVAYGQDHINVRISLGVAICPQDALDIDTLLKKADRALRRAKETGRNKTVVFSRLDLSNQELKGAMSRLEWKKEAGVR